MGLSGLFTLDAVRHQYGARVVLQIDRLEIARGETVAIVGPSGAGKSTLLRLLQFLERPTSGRIAFGAPLHHGSPDLDSRRRIATVFQRPLMFDRTVWENVAFGQRLRRHRDETLVNALVERLHLSPLARAQARTLSAGEVQRVALARALACDPEVLLLDEPTASLDPHNVAIVETVVRDCRSRGLTIVLSTHLFFQARRLADRTGLLLGGCLVEIAPTETLFEQPRDARTRAFLSGEMVY